jgi:hypothetical protein
MAVIPAGLLAAQGVTAAIGAGQTLAGARKSEFDKANEQRLNKLLGLEESGRMGLTGRERQLQERSLLSPVRRAAAETRRRAEALSGGMGGSGADLARLREEETRAIAAGGERAALELARADARKEAAQRQEMAQRQAIQEQRRQERMASLFGGLAQGAGAVGAMAGGVPEVMRAAGLFGAAINDTSGLDARLDEFGVGEQGKQMVRRMDPKKLTSAVSDAELFLQTGDDAFLTDDARMLLELRERQMIADDDRFTPSNAMIDAAIDDIDLLLQLQRERNPVERF